MTLVATITHRSGGEVHEWALQAQKVAGVWTWTTPAGKVSRLLRLQIHRAGESAPCMVLDGDGDGGTYAKLEAGVLSVGLKVPCPLGEGFAFVAVLSPAIFDAAGHTEWTSFTTKSNAKPLPGRTALPALVSGEKLLSLGSNVVLASHLGECLPFRDITSNPNNTNVTMILRSCEAVGGGQDVYLMGLVPQEHYPAKIEFSGMTLRANEAWTEIVQSAELLVALNGSPVAGRPPSWLVWMHQVPRIHDLWNRCIREPYRSALAQVAAGEDATFIPVLGDASSDAFSLCFRFEYWSRKIEDLARRRLVRVEPRVTSAAAKVKASFTGVPLIEGGVAFEYSGQPATPGQDDAEAETREQYHAWPAEFPLMHRERDVEAVRFRIRLREASAAASVSLKRTRFGSLDLGVAEQDTLHLDALAFSTGPWLVEESGPRRVPEVVACEVRVWEMRLSDVRPGAEDPLPNATRTALDARARSEPTEIILRALSRPAGSLIVPLGDGTRRSAAILEAQEQTTPGSSRSLVVRLRRDGQKPSHANQSVVYLSREPLLIAKVLVPSLAPDDIESDEIANWSLSELEGRKWELAASSRGFDLQMPPSAIAEAMEKGQEQPTLEEGKPIDFRFSAPAQMRLQSSWFRQGYAEASWNLARVLGYPGQRAPGAQVDRLSFELVYGITTVVDAAQVPSRLSLAELSSRLGSMAPILERVLLDGKGFPEGDARRHVFLSYRARWAQMLSVFRARLAVLEVYAPEDKTARKDDAGPKPFALQQGVTAYLRDGKYRLKDDELLAQPLQDMGADLRYPIAPERRPPGTYHDSGLAGGFSWPFESDAVFRNLLRDPVSNEAWVSGLRFSALGAWGDQRASFDNKRTKIITSTAMGRLSRITIERVGRIGVFWNRSKHVIVYERTVLPTRQFEAPRQKALKGRAVLRKVAEYVEILEPERRYPEFGAMPITRGFIEGSHFSSRRILVNSNWGADGPHGLEIPLWDPKEDPRIYPRPSIFLVTSGDKKGIADRVPLEVKEPDRLYFFSATDPALDDRTDLWPAYPEVDYGKEFLRVESSDGPAMNPDDPDASLPDAVADLPGWRRFTFPLEEADLPTNLVAARTEAASLNAKLTHISMMRAVPGNAVQPVDIAIGAVSTTRATLAQLQQNAAAAVASGLQGDALKARLTREITAARESLRKAAPAMADAAGVMKVQLESNDANAGVLRIGAELEANLQRQRTLAVGRINAWQDTAVAQLEGFSGQISAADYQGLLTGWDSTLKLALPQLKSGLEDQLRNLEGLSSHARQIHAAASEAIDALLNPLWNESVNTSFALEWLAMARQEMHESLQSLADSMPSDVPPLLQGALAKVRGIFKAVERALDAAFDLVESEVAARCDIWMTPLVSIRELKAKILGDPNGTYVEGEISLATPITLLAAARNAIRQAIEGLMQQLPELAALIAGALGGLVGGDPADIVRKLKDACAGATRELDTYFGGATDGLVKRLRDTAIVGALKDGVLAWDQTLDSLSNEWKAAEGKLQDWASDLAKQGGDAVEGWARSWAPQMRETFSGVEDLYGRARSLQADLGTSPTFQDPSSTLRLIRAVGEGPLLPEMTFNRDRMAYFFDDYAAAVRSSPVAALVNRVGDDLKALGIRVPTQAFLERIIPDSLQNFDLGKILPDFAALKNSALFDRLKLPAIANDTVKVTQGIDEANRMPWLKANVDIPISERAEVFSLGPLALILPKADFHASVDMRVAGGTLCKQQEAWIKADWLLEFGGLSLVTFKDTVMSFDEGGGMKFDIRADRIQMDAALQWLTDLIQAWQPDGASGLKLEMVYDGGRPVGAACMLGLALPPIGAGVFSISGLMLGAGLTLALDKESGEFAIGISFNLSRKIKPFTLTIAFLNGGGWVESQAKYLTSSRAILSQVSIGIVAGCGVEFALGPCAGSVYVQFGIFVEFSSGGAGGQTLSIGVMLLVRGSVLVFSIATVTITLLLQAVYRQDGTMTGYGSLSVSIRVSRFIKLSYSTQVTYNLAGGAGGQRQVRSAAAAAGTPPPTAGSQSLDAAKRHAQIFQ